jgi:hypothetical protein
MDLAKKMPCTRSLKGKWANCFVNKDPIGYPKYIHLTINDSIIEYKDNVYTLYWKYLQLNDTIFLMEDCYKKLDTLGIQWYSPCDSMYIRSVKKLRHLWLEGHQMHTTFKRLPM